MHYHLKFGDDSMRNKVWRTTRAREGTWKEKIETFFWVSEYLNRKQIRLSQANSQGQFTPCRYGFCWKASSSIMGTTVFPQLIKYLTSFGMFIWSRVKPGPPKDVSSKLIWSFFCIYDLLDFEFWWWLESDIFGFLELFTRLNLTPEMIQKFSTPKLHDRMCQTPLCQTCCCSIKCGRRRYIQSRFKCGL